MANTTRALLILLCITLQNNIIRAFTPASRSRATHALRASSPLGDLFSGITGVAPSSLQPPADVLRGTSIDPERDDVDLGRVYKVRDFTRVPSCCLVIEALLLSGVEPKQYFTNFVVINYSGYQGWMVGH
jgi:hypothetical protein